MIMTSSHSVEFGIELCNHFNIVFTNPVPEVGIGDGPVLLHLVKLLKLRIEPLEKDRGGGGRKKRRRGKERHRTEKGERERRT